VVRDALELFLDHSERCDLKDKQGDASCFSSFLREFVEDISLEPVEPFLPEMRIPLTTATALGYKTLHT